MHDKYSYEASLMALHDRDVRRTMACGIAGLSVAADSLSVQLSSRLLNQLATKMASQLTFEIEGDYPKYGNNDARVDDNACELVSTFMNKIRKLKTYRNSIPTQSVLTITSNVVHTVRKQVTLQTVVAGAPFALVLTQCTVVMRRKGAGSVTNVCR